MRAGVNDFHDGGVSARAFGIDTMVTEVIWRMCKPDCAGPLAVAQVIEGNLHIWHAIADPAARAGTAPGCRGSRSARFM